MQPPPHLVPEPFSGQDGKKRYGNDGAGGQDDGGPGQVQRRSQEAADEKFDGNAQHSQANEYIEGGRQVLQDFPGAIISVSHDRKYISQVCSRLLRLTECGLEEISKPADE